MPLPITKYHSDWLSLIEISGPFVSIPVLAEVFPQGLEDVPADLARSLRADFEFWQENAIDPAVHLGWVRLVLESLLGYSVETEHVPSVLLSGQAIPAGLKAEFPEHDETLRADFVLVEPRAVGSDQLSVNSERKPKLLIQVFPPSQSLEKAVSGSRWAASVGTRMMELLHATEIRLGLVTNGEQWMLVDAPRGETTGFATWYASLWFDERTTLNAFQSLLGVRRFFGVAEDETLDNLLARSANNQHEITDQLGLQVRHAVEILIQSLDSADQDRGRKLFGAEVSPDLLYEAALTVMMRLVFLLSAEEQKLLPIDEPLYSENYAVSTLREQLSKQAELGEEVLEYRYDAWSRLLAVFRAVYGGIHHQDLNLPAYGGSLFNPEKYPFLEGRSTEDRGRRTKEAPLPINNRTVLHLLNALQMLQVSGEMRRLSFRALDVEQIGHVYEGLLDHKATRADEVMLGLGGAKRLEPEIALSNLEQARAKGEASLEALLKDETQKSPSAVKKALAKDIHKDAQVLERLRAACGNNEGLLKRILPFSGLVRMDDFGTPAVIVQGSVYVTAGTTRRATGTHYTPRSLTEPVVQHTLEPLVYAGVVEGLPREQWKLRSPAELLALKICDMAMGSGGFLVQVVRYLAERLVEAWALYGFEGSGFEGSQVKNDDLLNYARRLVAERCIYGVDKNPLAVEIAKLSLWLVTLAKERPFTFLDHALKCGDALVGASEADFLRWARGYKNSAMTLFDAELAKQLETARGKRRELEGFVVRDVQDAERKEALLKEADAAMAHVKRGADLLTGARLLGLKGEELEALQNTLMLNFMAGELDPSTGSGQAIDPNKHYDAARALTAAQKECVFHWEFEFPEVFQHGGFSAIVGNPPFIGGQRITGEFGIPYRDYLVKHLADGRRGSADICAYFFLRGFSLLCAQGVFGLIATNTIAQGDTGEVGLDAIVQNNGVIFYAYSSLPWPGQAAVYVSIVHVSRKSYLGKYFLNDQFVLNISSSLDSQVMQGKPYRLLRNTGNSFQGSIILGLGFLLSPEDASNLIGNNLKNNDVIFPYLDGQDINTKPDQSPSRWVINFFDWDLENAKNYPECLSIVKEQVYPQRQALSEGNATSRHRKEFWWQYGSTALNLYRSIQSQKRILIIARTSKTVAFVFVPNGMIYNENTVVFSFENACYFSVLQSSIHRCWVEKFSSTLKNDQGYRTSDCFETYPFPKNLEGLEEIGERYHEERRQIMLSRQEGLTSTYNRFHNPEESAGDIVRLRELHVEMDKAVASAYGWGDLELGHDFHETAQGVRFTVSESARREILSRLLRLNHERYEEEQKILNSEVGIMNSKKKKAKSKSTDGQMGLL